MISHHIFTQPLSVASAERIQKQWQKRCRIWVQSSTTCFSTILSHLPTREFQESSRRLFASEQAQSHIADHEKQSYCNKLTLDLLMRPACILRNRIFDQMCRFCGSAISIKAEQEAKTRFGESKPDFRYLNDQRWLVVCEKMCVWLYVGDGSELPSHGRYPLWICLCHSTCTTHLSNLCSKHLALPDFAAPP